MTIRVIALLLSLSVSALSDDYGDDQEQACSFAGMKYLCENYEICSKFGLIDEDAKNALCGAYIDELNFSSTAELGSTPPWTYGPVSTPASRVVETERPTLDEVLTTTDRFTTGNLVTSREDSSSPTTTDDAFTTQLRTTGTEAGPTIDPEMLKIPPVISSPPVNITVGPGETGRFDCEAKSAMTPQVILTRKDQLSRPNLEFFNAYSGGQVSQTTVNSMKIDNVGEPNEGWYTCLACNRYGCDEQDAYLTVLDLCEGVTCPGDMMCVGTYAAGHGHTCACPDYCDSADMFVSDFVCSNYCEEQFNECLMKVDACRNGKFGIEVLNKGRCGQIEHPEILEEEFTFGVFELEDGDELVLECNAIGFPEPQIVWYRDEEIVGHGNYLIKSVSVADGGQYTCEAVNCMTTKVSKILAAVEVKGPTPPPPANVTTHPPPANVTTGAPVIPFTEPSSSSVDAPRSTCAVYGDPHFLTYDKNAYSYMGLCDNVLAMDCDSARWFVYGRMRPCGRTGGSCLESVTVFVDEDIIELQRGWLVNRSGKKIVPKNRKNKKIRVKGKNRDFTLLFDGAMLTLKAVLNTRKTGPGTFEHDKIVVRWDGFVSAQIQTPMNTKTCGMCGNNDGQPENDIKITRFGKSTESIDVFGNSWQVNPTGCPKHQKTRTSKEVCGERYQEVKTECERVFSISKFQGCITAGHDTTSWIDSCVYDECEGLLQNEELPPKCAVAQAYATQCGNPFWEKGDPVPKNSNDLTNWEMEAGCPDEAERLQPILDAGCPQPTLEEELAENF